MRLKNEINWCYPQGTIKLCRIVENIIIILCLLYISLHLRLHGERTDAAHYSYLNIKLDLTFISDDTRSLLLKPINLESNVRVMNEDNIIGRDDDDRKSNKNAGSSVVYYYDKLSLEEQEFSGKYT